MLILERPETIISFAEFKSKKRKADFLISDLETPLYSATKRVATQVSTLISKFFFRQQRDEHVITVLMNGELLNKIFSDTDILTLNNCRRVCRFWCTTADMTLNNGSFPLNYASNSPATARQLFEMHPFRLAALKEASIRYLANIAKGIGWISLLTVAEGGLIVLEKWRALKNASLSADAVLELVKDWNATNLASAAKKVCGCLETVYLDEQGQFRFQFPFSYNNPTQFVPMTPERYREMLAFGHQGVKVILGIMGLALLFGGSYYLYKQITGYEALSLEALKNKLWAHPALNNDQFLKEYICPISKRIMVLPVMDTCGHLFDYLSITNQAICPLTNQAIDFSSLVFRVDLCRQIHQRLSQLKRENSPWVQRMPLLVRQLEPNPY